MPTRTRQQIKDSVTPCGGLSYKNFINLLDSIPFLSDSIKPITVNTYKEMTDMGAPINTTLFNVLNDEDKKTKDTTYIWYANGKRDWLPSILDN